MGVVHIENVDEQILNSIRLRARISGRSFEDEARALLAEAAKPIPTPEEPVAEARRIQAMTNRWSPETDSVAVIREMRDRALKEPPAPMSPEEFAAEAARIRAMTPKDVVQTDSTEIIRELRDRGYAGR